VHTIQSGETLWAIAIQYATGSNLSAEEMLAQINRLNNSPTLIYPGQELVIAVPGSGVTVAEVAAAPQAESAQASSETDAQGAEAAAGGGEQPVAVAEVASGASASSSTLCVSAYHDRNSDGMRDPTTEELLANAGFTLSDERGVVGSYTSDGESEPYCFNQLIPGTYMVQLIKPVGYNTTTPEYWAVPLPAGATANVEFGHQSDPNAPVTEESLASASGDVNSGSADDLLQAAQDRSSASTEEAESGSKSLLSRLGEIAIGVGGLFVLLLAGAVGVAFVASRRRV
jgi:LysM repeat protein